MNNNIKWYVSSSGELHDITKVETTHLINALAKHHRDIYSSISNEQMIKHSEQINLIEEELLARNKKFHDEKFGGNK
jgi:hypothetical protein